jgi:hypothetical protein
LHVKPRRGDVRVPEDHLQLAERDET